MATAEFSEIPEYARCPTCNRLVSPIKPSTVCGRTCNTCGHMFTDQGHGLLSLDTALKEDVWWKPEMGVETKRRDKRVTCVKCFDIVYEAVNIVNKEDKSNYCLTCFADKLKNCLRD